MADVNFRITWEDVFYWNVIVKRPCKRNIIKSSFKNKFQAWILTDIETNNKSFKFSKIPQQTYFAILFFFKCSIYYITDSWHCFCGICSYLALSEEAYVNMALILSSSEVFCLFVDEQDKDGISLWGWREASSSLVR